MAVFRRRIGAFLRLAFGRRPDRDEKTRTPKNNIEVEAMLHGRSCCG